MLKHEAFIVSAKKEFFKLRKRVKTARGASEQILEYHDTKNKDAVIGNLMLLIEK